MIMMQKTRKTSSTAMSGESERERLGAGIVEDAAYLFPRAL